MTLGVGLLPRAPGTWGSALTAGLAGIWLAAGGALAGPAYWAFLVALSLLGVWLINAALARRLLGPSDDPGAIVIDEAAGMLLSLFAASLDPWWHLPLAFLLFRLFDIAKPWPVGISQRLPRGWGVMVDDLLAGGYALGLVWLARYWTG